MKIMIYAILSAGENSEKLNAFLAGLNDVSGEAIYAVFYNEIAVVAGDVNQSNEIGDRSKAIEYAGVIETLAQHYTLLPVRYGSAMDSADAICNMVEKNYHDICQNLLRVENKFEFGLKVFCDSEKTKSVLGANQEAVSTDSSGSDPKTENSASREWINRKLKEHRLEELILAYVNSVVEEITENLARFNAINKFKKMVTVNNIIDAVFLLDKNEKDTLIQVIGELQNRHASLTFILTGPWPPYSFVDFTVK